MEGPPKPRLPETMLDHWQRIVNLMARILEVPAGLIMELDGRGLKVCVSSASDGNPYERGEVAQLDTGLYCETVMAERSALLVRNALEDPAWKDNPDVEKSMLFYLGLPLSWPDGELFGTICVLDAENNEKAIRYRDLLEEFKGLINGDPPAGPNLPRRLFAEAYDSGLLRHRSMQGKCPLARIPSSPSVRCRRG